MRSKCVHTVLAPKPLRRQGMEGDGRKETEVEADSHQFQAGLREEPLYRRWSLRLYSSTSLPCVMDSKLGHFRDSTRKQQRVDQRRHSTEKGNSAAVRTMTRAMSSASVSSWGFRQGHLKWPGGTCLTKATIQACVARSACVKTTEDGMAIPFRDAERGFGEDGKREREMP